MRLITEVNANGESHKRGQTCYLGGCLLLQPPLCDLRLLQWLRLFMTQQWTLQ